MTLADGVNMLLQNPDDIVHPLADETNFEIEDTTIEEDLDVNTTDGKVGKQWYTSKSRQWNKFSHLEEAIYTICEDKIHAKFDEIPLNENDNSLGPGGDIRMYLEGLATSKNVQKYIEQHPFGQQALTESDPSWPHYLQLINSRLHAPSDPGL
ncbi:hypothetical protein IFM89_024693 [Coptis chinensis]|uniref:Uncharacterized protein n=1 Tax=Coptis chinensis TaxID=261450 RepID=A0A835IV00_9MAGN|nr:hypothetical protein IFM89_024693 [Coptis chinensis]